MLSSTLDHLDHIQHQTQKEKKQMESQKLAQRIAALSKADYDNETYSIDEIKKETGIDLQLCEKFNIEGSILASEIINSKKELEALRNEKIGFRSQGQNDQKILELDSLIEELDAILRVNLSTAQRYQSVEDKQKSYDACIEDIQPLCDQLKEIEKALKEKFDKAREIQSSDLVNPINPDMFRLAYAMSTPGGVFV